MEAGSRGSALEMVFLGRKQMTFRMARLMVLCMAVLAMAVPSSAQVYTGRIDVTVADATGAILPNVTVVLNGPTNATAVSDAKGEVHFLNLAPGTYGVTARLDGFNEYSNKNVPVVTGGAVPLRVAMTVGTVATQVDVTAETPTIDPRKLATATNVTYQELQNIPSSRDPWVILQTVPGIITDRVNVGGAESGQQSNYQAKGAPGADNTWNMDGVSITDMSALGSSPTYYDFDMFQEMQVTTGGADLTNGTPGVALNFVLKSGSNTPHGSSRVYYENEDMQSNNLDKLSEADRTPLLGLSGKGNRMDEYTDYGFELGGPIVKDRLWAWGAYGKTDVTVLSLNSVPDQTILKNTSFKATGQPTDKLRGSFTYFRGAKEKFGRVPIVGNEADATWNQGGPTQLYKGEANIVSGNNLFLSGRFAYVDGGFFLTPRGGLDTNMIFADDSGVGRFSWYEYKTIRPQYNTSADGNYFRGRHEVKFGFGYKTADVDSFYTVPGNAVMTYHAGYPNMIAEVTAWNHFTGTSGKYINAFIGDTISYDRLTLNFGVRWDRQASSVLAYAQNGNPLLPSLLPDLTGQAADDVIVWNSIVPRVGLTYALNESRKTLLRASYATFASQMNAGQGGFFSTVGSFRSVYFYDVVDLNGNRTVDANEIAGRTCTEALANAGVCNWLGFSISNPGNVSAPNHVIGDYKTPLTHEVILGFDHELMPNFGLTGSFTWRRFTDFNWRPVEGLRSDDYVQSGTFNATLEPVGNVSVPFYAVAPDRLPADRTRTEYVDREDYWQRYLGFELSATKRLSNRWMARFGFSTNDHREYFDGPNSLQDPTSSPTNPNIDGGQVMRQTGGSGKSGIFMLLPKYQFIATGMYQAAWGINLAANLVNRQGYAMPYNRNQVATGDPLVNLKTLLLVDSVADFRLPSVTSLDFRVGKELAFSRARFNLDVDVFNLFNNATVLGREYNLRLTSADDVREIMNPRILRVGVRFNF
jgi:Carboxypeptidase regulatory-like domain